MYKNSVLNVPGRDHGDPSILRYCGLYYLYHTAFDAVPVYISKDLVHWQYHGIALEASKNADHWAAVQLWAPEVIYADGRFYMYVTGTKKVDGQGDDSSRRIGVAVSDSPTGPFILADEPLTDEWSIDAHPFQDSDGTWYMFYNVRNEYTRGPNDVIGCGNVVDKMVTLEKLEGRPSLVCKPEFDHEGTHEGDWYWNEGPFTIKRNGKYYQMYSGGCFFQSTYHVAYAVSDVCRGPDGMKDQSYTKWPNDISVPILQSTEKVWGPGHHVVTQGPNGVDLYVVYHGHVGRERHRKAFIDPLYWHDDTIYIAGPTVDEQPGPYLPSIFKQEWHITKESFLPLELTDYVWELWTGLKSGLCFYLAYGDDSNYLALKVNGCGLSIISVIDGETTRHALDIANPPCNHLQCLRTIKNGNRIDLYLNGRRIWSGTWSVRPARVGASSEQSHMFKGVLLTNFFADSFAKSITGKESSSLITHTLKDTLEPWETLEGRYEVADKGIRGLAAHNEIRRAFSADDFRFSMDITREGRAAVELASNIRAEIGFVSGKLFLNGIPYSVQELKDRSWVNVVVERVGTRLRFYYNGAQVADLDACESEKVREIRISSDMGTKINNITIIEIVNGEDEV